MTPLRRQLIASCAAEGIALRPVRSLADVLADIAEVGPIREQVRPLNERLWVLHQRCAAGVITSDEEAELDVLCALAEQQYQREQRR